MLFLKLYLPVEIMRPCNGEILANLLINVLIYTLSNVPKKKFSVYHEQYLFGVSDSDLS